MARAHYYSEVLKMNHLAEASLIAVTLLFSQYVTEISETVAPEAFASPANATIYRTRLDMAAQGEHADLVTLTARMQRERTIDAIGGPAVLAEIFTLEVLGCEWRGYADEILDGWQLRQAKRVAHQIQEAPRLVDAEEAIDTLQSRRRADEPAASARPAPPWDAFDPYFCGLAESIGDSMSLPHAAALVAAHVILGGFMGKSVRLELAPSWSVFPNVYMVCSGDTGSGKSATSAPLMEIAMKLDAEMCALAKNAKTRTTAKVDALKGRLAKIQAEFAKGKATEEEVDAAAREVADAEETPTGLANLVIQDATGEAAAQAAYDGDGALMILASEARKVLKVVFGKYTKGENDDDIFLAGSSGDAIKVNRKGSDPIVLKKPCFSAVLFVQPDIHDKIISDPTLAVSGFARRLLIFGMEKCRDEPNRRPPPINPDALLHFENRCLEGLFSRRTDINGQLTVPQRVCRLSESAADFVHELRCEFKRDDSGDPWIETFIEFVGKWSLILHAARYGPQECHNFNVSLETVKRADAIMRWFRANRAYGAELSPEINRLRAVSQKCTEGFATRDVQRQTPQLSVEQAKSLVSRWIADGYVRATQRVYRGRKCVTNHVTDEGWKLLNNTK